MPSFSLQDLLKKKQSVIGGAPASTQNFVPPVAPPPASTARPLVGKIWDQLNVLDNNRTFKQAAPTNVDPLIRQVTHGTPGAVVGGLVKPLIQFPMDWAQASGNLGTRLAGGQQQSAQQMWSDPLTSNVRQLSDATGTNRQLLGSGAQVGLTAFAPGVDALAAKGVTYGAGLVAPKLASEVIGGTAAGLGAEATPAILRQILKYATPTVSGALLGGPFNTSNLVSSDAPLTPKSVKDTFAQGAAFGGALGLAAPVAGTAIKGAGKVTTGLIDKTKPLNEGGYAKIPGVGGEDSVKPPTTKLVTPKPAENPLAGLNDGQLMERNYISNMQAMQGEGAQLPKPPVASEKYYHGTTKANGESIIKGGLKPSENGQLSWLTSDSKSAGKFAKASGGDTVLSANVKLKNPLIVSEGSVPAIVKPELKRGLNYSNPEVVAKLKAAGYDGVKQTTKDGSVNILPFESKGQVKFDQPKPTLTDNPFSPSKPSKIKPKGKDLPIVGSKINPTESPSSPLFLTKHEKIANQYLRDNPKQAIKDYNERILKNFDTNKPNIVSADEIKHVIPGFAPEKSVAYHEPGKAFVQKEVYKKLLEDPKTKDQPVLFTSGGTGAGKSTSLLKNTGSLENHAAVYDGNLAKFSSAVKKIDQALNTGRDVQIVHVFRDPVEAFTGGVIPRIRDEGRAIAIDTHINTHTNSVKVLRELADKYKDNPKVDIKVIDNSRGFGNSTEVPVSFLDKKLYNIDRLKGTLHEESAKALKTGQIDQATHDAITGQLGDSTSQQLKSQRSTINETSRSAKTGSDQGLTKTPKNKDLPIVGPDLNKKQGFASGVTKSNEVSPELKAIVKEKNPTYVPVSNADQLAASEKFVKKGLTKANNDVHSRLNVKPGEIDAQTVSDSIATMKALDAKGGAANHEQASIIADKLSEHLTKQGQSVQAASLLSNRTPEGILYGARKVLKKAGVEITPELQKSFDESIAKIKSAKPGETRDYAVAEFTHKVNKLIPSSFADKAVSLWKAGLLTGVKTQTGNALSNLTSIGLKTISNPIAAAIDKTSSLFTGERTKTFTTRGDISGGVEGVKAGAKYLKTGIDERNLTLSKFDTKRVNFSNTVHGRAAQKYVDSVFGLMGAADRPYYYSQLRNNLQDIAKADAINNGLKGAAREAHIQDFIKNPPKEAFQTATDAAEKSVFANDTLLSKGAGGLRRSVEGHPAASAALNIIMPFTKVPSAVITRLFDYTPVGAVKTLVENSGKGNFNQRAFSEGLAEAGTGTGLMAIGYHLAKNGQMTGSYPKDSKEQELWKLEGKQENAIKAGGKWHSINYTSPAGQVLQTGAKVFEAAKAGEKGTGLITGAIAGAGKTVIDQSFLSGVQGALDLVNDPQRNAEKYARQQIASIVPTLSSDFAKAIDNKQRQANNPTEAIKAKIPFASKTLKPKIDAFGNALDRASSSANTLANPFRPTDIKQSTPLTTELRRLQDQGVGVMPNPGSKTLKVGKETIKLNPNEVYNRDTKIGKAVEAAWTQIIADPRYSSMSDDEKQKVLSNVLSDVNAVNKAEYVASSRQDLFGNVKLSTDQSKIASGTPAGDTAFSVKSSGKSTTTVPTFKTTGKVPKATGKTKGTTSTKKTGKTAKAKKAKYNYPKGLALANSNTLRKMLTKPKYTRRKV